VVNASSSIIAVMKPAGLDKSKGAVYGKDPTDPRWKDDAGVKDWKPSPQNISAPRISRTNSRSTATMSRS
jgi:branched-chain amino acid transport system substrate-binding protein